MPVPDRLFDEKSPLEIADQGCFFVGGRYVDAQGGRIMSGQMFAQYQVPKLRRYPYPIVMIHGGAQTGVNFLGTPDGRRGWADYFVANGFTVYVVDQPGRGRSGFFSDVYGKTEGRDAQERSDRFTATAMSARWPQAQLLTQWPGSGIPGDPVFDQFYASQVESMVDVAAIEGMMREAGSSLLDRIGPAILLTHSQSGLFGWTITDKRPSLVKGIVALEPQGPPVYEVKFTGTAQCFENDAPNRPWGITRGPLNFVPAAAKPEDMSFIQQDRSDAPNLVRCWLQAEPARQLPNLQGIPILLLVVSEASMHAAYCHCTSRFLSQAGVQHEFVRLEDVGIRGNGHMMMLEKNNLEVALFLRRWIERNIG